MVSRLLIGDNNLTRFWPAFQFGRPLLKGATLITSTDLDTLDNALSQIEEKDQVILSVLTSILMDEVNVLEVASSSLNICSEVVTRLVGLCPQHQSCQVRVVNFYGVFVFCLFFCLNCSPVFLNCIFFVSGYG